MTAPQPSDPVILSHMKRLWIHGFVVGLGVVSAIFLVWFIFFSGGDTEADNQTAAVSVQPAPPEAAPPAAPLPPEVAAADLKEQLSETLARMRDANLQKDLPQLLGQYSDIFPEREKKRQEILKSWKTFDYLNLAYRVDEIKSAGADRAVARVTWSIRTRDRATGNLSRTTRAYRVWFSKEANRWRIMALEKAG